MKLSSVLLVAAALAVAGGVVAYRSYTGSLAMKARLSARPQATAVSTAVVREDLWRREISSVATLESREGIMVSAEVAGRVASIHFESGAQVRKGDLLVVLDDSSEVAQLAGLRAAAKLADLNLHRARDLRERGSNTPTELDAAEAALAQADAAVAQTEATIAKKHIHAAFDGRLGIRLVSTGQYAAAGTAFVQLEDVGVVYADFGLPQQQLSSVQAGLEVSLAVDSFPGRVFVGRVEAVNPRISESTRNFRVRAAVPNPGGELRPGMFGHVRAEVGEPARLAVVPGSAIVYSPYGDYVYVVGRDASGASTVRQQFVSAGEKRGDLVSITAGLKPGEVVVIAGQMKLRNGAEVKVDNTIVPSAEAAPKPVES